MNGITTNQITWPHQSYLQVNTNIYTQRLALLGHSQSTTHHSALPTHFCLTAGMSALDQIHTRLLSVQAMRYFMSGLSEAWLINGGLSILFNLLLMGSLVSALRVGHNRVHRGVSVSPQPDLSEISCHHVIDWCCKKFDLTPNSVLLIC